MNAAHRIRYVAIAAVGAGSLALAGCSSSGGGGAPTQQQIVNKLKSDSTVKTQLGPKVNNNSSALNLIDVCLAKVMQKDLKAGDLNDYVNGKKSIQQLGQNTSDQKISSDFAGCAQNGVDKGSVTPSAPSSS